MVNLPGAPRAHLGRCIRWRFQGVIISRFTLDPYAPTHPWLEVMGNPISCRLRYLILGEGDTAPVTREVPRKAIANPRERPRIHVG
jgi:hypothetical protein